MGGRGTQVREGYTGEVHVKDGTPGVRSHDGHHHYGQGHIWSYMKH